MGLERRIDSGFQAGDLRLERRGKIVLAEREELAERRPDREPRVLGEPFANGLGVAVDELEFLLRVQTRERHRALQVVLEDAKRLAAHRKRHARAARGSAARIAGLESL